MVPDYIVPWIPYFVLAYNFGWTKSQVDAEDADYIEKMLIMLRTLNDSEGGKEKVGGGGGLRQQRRNRLR